jgi:YVTN family beta-propeller protein
MTSFRKAGLAAILLCGVLGAGCGDVFRPVAGILDPQPGGTPQARRHALVVNQAGGALGSVTFINVSGDSSVLHAPVGAGPVHVSLSPDTVRAYVSNRDEDTVSIVVTTILSFPPIHVTLPAGAAPRFALATSNDLAYVAMTGLNAVGVIPTASQALSQQIPVGSMPVALAGRIGGDFIYCVNQGDNTVTVIRVGDLTVAATIPVGASPVWAALNNEGTLLYVLNQGAQTVSVIDTVAQAVIATLPVGPAPESLYFDRRLRRLYVPNTGGNTVHIFRADVTVPQLLAEVVVGPAPRAVVALEDGLRAYVANSGGNTVSVISTTSNTVTGAVQVGDGPAWIDASSDATKVYTANRLGNSISVIETAGNSVVATHPAGSSQPVFLMVSP